MTGAETKALLIWALRADYWLLESPEDVEEAFAKALTALYPCIVLTAEEANRIAEAVAYAYADGFGVTDDAAELLALLTPDDR